MKGGAITLAKNYLASLVDFDPILAAELIDLTKFLALSREKSARTSEILNMHENQLTCPLPLNAAAGPMRTL